MHLSEKKCNLLAAFIDDKFYVIYVTCLLWPQFDTAVSIIKLHTIFNILGCPLTCIKK